MKRQKTFEVSYMVRYSTTEMVEAKTEEEARAKFREIKPSSQILYITEYVQGEAE